MERLLLGYELINTKNFHRLKKTVFKQPLNFVVQAMDAVMTVIGNNTPIKACFIAASPHQESSGIEIDYAIKKAVEKQVRLLLKGELNVSIKNQDFLGLSESQIIAKVLEECEFVVFFASADLLDDNGFNNLIGAIFDTNGGNGKKISCCYVICRDIVIDLLPQPDNKDLHIPILPLSREAVNSTANKQRYDAVIVEVCIFIKTAIASHRNAAKLVAVEKELANKKEEINLLLHIIDKQREELSQIKKTK